MIIKKKKIYTVNPDCDIERLLEIARANNSRISRGEETTITLGHTSDSDPELITIPVGHAENFVVEDEDLFVDFIIDDEWAEQIKKYNKVSIELWADQIITPIALLSRNRPALEVGLIKYQMPIRKDDAENEEIQHKPYMSIDEEKEVLNMSPDELRQLIIEEMQHSEAFAKCSEALTTTLPQIQEQLKKMSDTLAPLMEEEAAEPEHADIAPELEGEAKEIEGEKAPEEVAKEEVKEEETPVEDTKPLETEEKKEEVKEGGEGEKEEDKKEVEKNDMAAASANNTYVPELGKKKKYQEDQDLVVKYQERLLKAEQEKNELLEKAQAEKDALFIKYQREARKNDLTELAKTYVFNFDEELDIVGKMDESQFENHKKIIVTRYQKTPLNRGVSVAMDIEDRDVAKPEKVNRAIKYATDHGCSFKEALEKV
jgi:hypothetical protein